MTKLLHFSASPRGEASHSLAVAKAFLDGYVEANPEVEVEEVNLFDGTLPAFGRLAAEAKMALFAGAQPSPEQSAEWDTAKAVFDRFAAADAYLFSIPMWNSGIPYVLKQWIDIVTQPGWVFGFTPENGYEGLISAPSAASSEPVAGSRRGRPRRGRSLMRASPGVEGDLLSRHARRGRDEADDRDQPEEQR